MSIEQIRKIDRQLTTLQRIRDKGSYLASGLTLDLWLGVKSDEDGLKSSALEGVQLGMFSGVETELIDLLIRGLTSARVQWMKDVRKEAETLTEFLKDHDQES